MLQASGQPPRGPVAGRFIVKVNPKADLNAMRQSLAAENHLNRLAATIDKPNVHGLELFENYYIFSSASKSITRDDVIAELGSSNIISIEQDHYVEFFDWPGDSYFSDQWYLYNEGQAHLAVVRIEGEGNDILTTHNGKFGEDVGIDYYYANPPPETTSVVVAIIDTGLDPTHPELQGQLWTNSDEVPDNGIDDDHNGYIDDYNGYDISGDTITIIYVNGDNDVTDTVGHGTHLAGIVAAKADDFGVTGMAPFAKVMPIKITPNSTVSVGAAAVIYAVVNGARIINISWGTLFESTLLREAISFARQNDVLVCIAAGNSGTSERFFPAAFDSSFVIGATNSDGFLTYFTTFGSHIRIVAPGQDILSLRAAGTDLYAAGGEPGVRIVDPESYLYIADGTSMSTPLVAGAAARVLSIRPDLNREQIENILVSGADDLIDPFNRGDNLPGYDTLSGYGRLNVKASLDLLNGGGMYFLAPELQARLSEDFDIRIAAVAGYDGGWILEYSLGFGSTDWQVLASGATPPIDSIAYAVNNGVFEGHIRLRLTDDFGNSRMTSFSYVRQRQTEIQYPTPDTTLKYNVEIRGSVFGPDFDSMAVFYQREGSSRRYLYSSSGEFFDSLLYIWSASGQDTGRVSFYLYGYYTAETVIDSVTVNVASTFTAGWPQRPSGVGPVTPVCADLDHDGSRELIVSTSSGLYVYQSDGVLVPGYPIMPLMDMRCIPAIYDVDHDGEDEIIATNDSGLYVFNRDGTIIPGWPRYCVTGSIPYGYSYPNPTVAGFSYWDIIDGQTQLVVDSAVMIINKAGQLLAYNFDGSSYFASLGGLFAYYDKRASDIYRQGGETSPLVTSSDLDGDGAAEVVASYTSAFPYSGLAVFNSKNGQPAYDVIDPVVQTIVTVHGTALADLNGDGNPEIISSGVDVDNEVRIWVKTNGNVDYPGFPITVPGIGDWIASYPVIADLDLNGSPEILLTAFEFDISSLYIFKADGTPYLPTVEGRPEGEAMVQLVTFGTPTVADVTGDDYPEILFRSGYIIPGSGPERLYVLDYKAQLLPGWPINTPSRPNLVFSSRFAPLVDDIDSDNKVEVILIGDGGDLMAWDFDASYDNGKNRSRFLYDNLNSGIYPGSSIPTAVGDYPYSILPDQISLNQNFPNPFNPTTFISFDLPRASHVKVDVLNVLGQLVHTIIETDLSAGHHNVKFDGSNYASGVYFYRLQTDQTALTRKMVLLK